VSMSREVKDLILRVNMYPVVDSLILERKESSEKTLLQYLNFQIFT